MGQDASYQVSGSLHTDLVHLLYLNQTVLIHNNSCLVKTGSFFFAYLMLTISS